MVIGTRLITSQTSLACSWLWGPGKTNMFWGWNNLRCQLFNQKCLYSGLTWTRSPLHHQWLLWCTSSPTEAKGRNYSNERRSLHRESLQYCWKRHGYDLNPGEINTSPETHRFWGHKWPCLRCEINTKRKCVRKKWQRTRGEFSPTWLQVCFEKPASLISLILEINAWEKAHELHQQGQV